MTFPLSPILNIGNYWDMEDIWRSWEEFKGHKETFWRTLRSLEDFRALSLYRTVNVNLEDCHPWLLSIDQWMFLSQSLSLTFCQNRDIVCHHHFHLSHLSDSLLQSDWSAWQSAFTNLHYGCQLTHHWLSDESAWYDYI